MLKSTSIWAMMTAIIVLNTIAQSLLKLGAGRGLINGALFGGVVAYGLSTLLYVLILGRTSLSFAYPVVIGSTAIFTCIAGRQVFGEKIGVMHWLGIALVVTGIALIATVREA